MLGYEIWLPMFCTVSPWHSYEGSTSLPDYIYNKKLNIFSDREWMSFLFSKWSEINTENF